MNLAVIIANIDMNAMTLPQFQRGYVWNRRQVRELMRSLYNGYPIGSLLVWKTQARQHDVRGDQPLAVGVNELLLDGQQRVTSLYGIVKGKAPPFCNGDCTAFLNLYFNLETEEFEFYGPSKMQNNPLWISVTELMQKGVGHYFDIIMKYPDAKTYHNRLTAIETIKNFSFHVEIIAEKITKMDDVVDIFNQVNSGGTKLSKGDLALAKICADWPQARVEMQKRLDKWAKRGYWFNLDWLLRCMNALLTGHSDFAELDRQEISSEQIRYSIQRTEKHIDRALDLISGRLGLDHRNVLGSPNSKAAIVRYFDRLKSPPDHTAQDRLLYWYVNAMIWGRYSGPVETVIRQDIMAVDENDDSISALIEILRRNRGNLRIEPDNFTGATRGSRYFPLLYMLTRVYGTSDFDSGVELRMHMLGKNSQLELHHIFPKAKLRDYGYHWRNDVNALANFTFLTKETNLRISAKSPKEYFPYYEAKHPGVLKSHWIPEDPELWKIENYHQFLAERRKLLAQAANNFLDQLYHGKLGQAETPASTETNDHNFQHRPVSISSDEEEAVLQAAMAWMESQSLPRGEYGFELVAADGELLATLDLAWPRGIQEGMTRQAALLINESEETRNIAEDHDYKCFTSLAGLQHYVRDEILGESEPV